MAFQQCVCHGGLLEQPAVQQPHHVLRAYAHCGMHLQGSRCSPAIAADQEQVIRALGQHRSPLQRGAAARNPGRLP